MKKAVFVLLMLSASLAFAGEILVTPDLVNIPGTAPRQAPETMPIICGEPSWRVLESMGQDERLNCIINLDLGPTASEQAQYLARKIELLWNDCKFEAALALFPSLERIYDIRELGIGNSWRTPIPTLETPLWGSDVRIGNRDSIFVQSFDVDRSSDHLFAVVMYATGSQNLWAMNFSSDGGATWTETYSWFASYTLKTVSAEVVGAHCFIAFGRGAAQDQAFLYRCRTSDGAQEQFNNGSNYVTVFTTTAPDSVKEVVVASNQDYYDNRLYYSAITTSGLYKLFWGDTTGVNWTAVTTNVTNAEKGLDISCNENFDSLYVWGSYFTYQDTLKIGAIVSPGDLWHNKFSYAIGSGSYSSIGAFNDTIFCTFDYMGTIFQCRYLVSYNGGQAWYWGVIGDTTSGTESPDLTARYGGGVTVVYRYYTSPRQERFTRRPLTGGWSTPFSIANNEPYYNKPAVEYLGNGECGVVYLSWTSPQIRAAYFDRGSVVRIEDNVSVPDKFEILDNYPNPFNAATWIRYSIPQEADVTVTIYDIAGRRLGVLLSENQEAGYHEVIWDASDVASGMYFYTVRAGSLEETRKMTLLK